MSLLKDLHGKFDFSYFSVTYCCGCNPSADGFGHPENGLRGLDFVELTGSEDPTGPDGSGYLANGKQEVFADNLEVDTAAIEDLGAEAKAHGGVVVSFKVTGSSAPSPRAARFYTSQIDPAKLMEFRRALEVKGIAVDTWGCQGSKSMEHLFWECFYQRGCILTGLTVPGVLKRVAHLVKVKLTATISNVEHTLMSRLLFRHDGVVKEESLIPRRKLIWHTVEEDIDEAVYTAEVCPYTENWRTGYEKILEELFGLSLAWQQQHLLEPEYNHTYRVEDNMESEGFPGLTTLYCIHDVTVNIADTRHPDVAGLGLPHGTEFSTVDNDFSFEKVDNGNPMPIGTQMHIWAWMPERSSVVRMASELVVSRIQSCVSVASEQLRAGIGSGVAPLIKRVPLPATSAQAMARMRHRMGLQLDVPPNAALWAAMEGRGRTGRWRSTLRSVSWSRITPCRSSSSTSLLFQSSTSTCLRKLRAVA